ncbi:MAG: right-handed parallel beta-helix repeat-containing protein, partial [Paludibacteraceae bacterium]|nr:right-handed parallel beta-helix repeat-containing protein [Paludibacteraceae bacterium]
MKKLLALLTAIVAGVSALFAQTVVTTDAEIRSAVQVNNANIQLGADINLSNKTLEIPKNSTVTLDLNGHKLDRNLTKRGEGGGQVITVRQDATLNLSNGTLTGGWGGAGGGLVNEGGTVTLTDVIISNNVADDRGGGICNRNGGVLTMTNCTITDNHSNDHSGAKGGGGFFNEENATATLTNVSITGNEAKVCGGGGICNFGTLTLDGCTIQNNAAITNGGGIWQEGTLNVQGANIVTGNTTVDNKPNNLFLKTGALLTVTGSLAGSTILVDMESGTGTLTSGYNTHNSGVDPATFFQSEWPDIMDVTLENNEAKLGSSLAEGDYYYIDNHWSDGKLTYETKILHQGEYKLIKPGYYEDTDLNMSGTYVVVTNDKGYKCHYDGIAYVTANTKIILCDGAKLEIEGCLLVAQNEAVLDVYGQVNNTGVLQTHGDITHYGENYPGIGSGKDDVTDMYFHGGHIIAKGENSYAGIGGGHTGDNYSRMFFYNANVEATGGSGGPGIGTWYFANDFDNTHVYIYGGTIKAYGGEGGVYGAGIGGGNGSYGLRLYVYGGEVYAYGAGNAAGIGGGWGGGGGWVEVYGGLVKAYGGDNGAGIGSGSKPFLQDDPAQAGGLKVYGGEVYAYGGVDAAGVGGGEDCYGGDVEVYGGYLYAEGNDNGAGIGGGEDGDGGWVTINGGTVVAKTTGTDEGSRAIGPGDGSDDYKTLDIGDDMMVISERKFTAAERKNACWYRTNVRVEVCDHSDGFTYTVDGTGPNDHHISH